MTDNKYTVPAKRWDEWDDHQRAVFNGVYADILQMGAACFLHPDTIKRKLSTDEFGTIAWNAAWLAADHLGNPEMVSEVTTVDEEITGQFVPAASNG